MYHIILAFITAFMLTYYSIPSVIHIARKKKLYDTPGERSSHTKATPSLGGVSIFAGILFSIVLWTPFEKFGNLQYILCSLLLIFLIGVKDDILPISPKKKFIGQIVAAAIVSYKAEIYLTSFYGLFGIENITYSLGLLLSILVVSYIVNAVNLLDGINGLAGCITLVVSVFFGVWFFAVDRIELSILAFSLVGSVIAFLKFNFSPAQIFMGDSGALLLGLICSILTIEFIEFNQGLMIGHPYRFESGPAVAIGVLILPLFDTLRVFTTRILRKKSPFQPDRNHIHHLMLDSGLSHMQATSCLIFVNILFIFFVYYFQDIGTLYLASSVLLIASFLSGGLYLNALKKNKIKKSGVNSIAIGE